MNRNESRYGPGASIGGDAAREGRELQPVVLGAQPPSSTVSGPRPADPHRAGSSRRGLRVDLLH